MNIYFIFYEEIEIFCVRNNKESLINQSLQIDTIKKIENLFNWRVNINREKLHCRSTNFSWSMNYLI